MIAATALVVVVAVVLRLAPLWTGPVLPAGAIRLHIVTASPNLDLGCAAALLSPVRITTAETDLILVTVESGNPVQVVWPSGFAAWRVAGRAVLADPWGSVVGREGDVLDSLGGGLGIDDAFHICRFGIVTAAG